jgi:hypothetical protein
LQENLDSKRTWSPWSFHRKLVANNVRLVIQFCYLLVLLPIIFIDLHNNKNIQMNSRWVPRTMAKRLCHHVTCIGWWFLVVSFEARHFYISFQVLIQNKNHLI